MLGRLAFICALLATAAPAGTSAATEEEFAELRREFEQMRFEYEERIAALEARVRERSAATPGPTRAPNALNPSIGLVLDGKYRAFTRDSAAIPGFALGDEAGPGSEGISLGETELNLSASVDDKFYGSMTLALVDDGQGTEVELENAYVQTLAAPFGTNWKAGRFFSGVGYLNGFHSHSDDFADRPLVYRALLGGQYADDGLQLRWVAPTELFVELGGELLSGNRYPGGGNEGSGKGAWSGFAHIGGDIGASQSWRAGGSVLSVDAKDRDLDGDLWTGTSRIAVADLVWKWAPYGNPSRMNLKLQGEFLWLDSDGDFTPAGGVPLRQSSGQTGWYAQAVHQFLPGWRWGVRYGELDAAGPGSAFVGTVLDDQGHTPRQLTWMVDWSNSEASRIRLQYNRDRSDLEPNDRFTVQYIMSIGAHGAHQY